MSVPSRLRTPNPHLGAYYGIVTSAFVSLVIMLAMFEQLGWGRPLLAQSMMHRAAGALSPHRRRRAHLRGRGLFRLGPARAAGVQRLRAGGRRGRRRGLSRLHGHRVLSRLRRARHRAWLDLRHAARRHPVRALFAQGRLLYPAELSRPSLSLAQLAHGGKRDAAPADRAARRRRDQDRRADRRAVPAGLLLHRRAGACGADRGDRHSRRHAVADLDGKRGVPGRRGRVDRGGDHRVGPPHQRAGAATDLWRDVLVLAQCRDHGGAHAGRARRARHRSAGRHAGADGQAVPATVRQSRPDGFRHAVSLPRARHGGAAEPA